MDDKWSDLRRRPIMRGAVSWQHDLDEHFGVTWVLRSDLVQASPGRQQS